MLDPQDLCSWVIAPGFFSSFFFLTDEVFKDYIDGKLKHGDLKEKIETWTHQSLIRPISGVGNCPILGILDITL